MDIALKCQCGTVQGTAKGVETATSNRIVCYCDDCQSFARTFDKTTVLDSHGGTDILQLTPAHISIEAGSDQVKCLRLTEKGMYRWYAACCDTPMANTLSSSMPFIGIIHNFVKEDMGTIRAVDYRVHGKFASNSSALMDANEKMPFGLLGKVMLRVIKAKLFKQGDLSALFPNGQPLVKPRIATSQSD